MKTKARAPRINPNLETSVTIHKMNGEYFTQFRTKLSSVDSIKYEIRRRYEGRFQVSLSNSDEFIRSFNIVSR
jgi:hypothetical protein